MVVKLAEERLSHRLVEVMSLYAPGRLLVTHKDAEVRNKALDAVVNALTNYKENPLSGECFVQLSEMYADGFIALLYGDCTPVAVTLRDTVRNLGCKVTWQNNTDANYTDCRYVVPSYDDCSSDVVSVQVRNANDMLEAFDTSRCSKTELHEKVYKEVNDRWLAVGNYCDSTDAFASLEEILELVACEVLGCFSIHVNAVVLEDNTLHLALNYDNCDITDYFKMYSRSPVEEALHAFDDFIDTAKANFPEGFAADRAKLMESVVALILREGDGVFVWDPNVVDTITTKDGDLALKLLTLTDRPVEDDSDNGDYQDEDDDTYESERKYVKSVLEEMDFDKP